MDPILKYLGSNLQILLVLKWFLIVADHLSFASYSKSTNIISTIMFVEVYIFLAVHFT